jgi:hypothetical protein
MDLLGKESSLYSLSHTGYHNIRALQQAAASPSPYLEGRVKLLQHNIGLGAECGGLLAPEQGH